MKIIRNKELLKKGAAYSLCGFGQNVISGLVTGYIMVFSPTLSEYLRLRQVLLCLAQGLLIYFQTRFWAR